MKIFIFNNLNIFLASFITLILTITVIWFIIYLRSRRDRLVREVPVRIMLGSRKLSLRGKLAIIIPVITTIIITFFSSYLSINKYLPPFFQYQLEGVLEQNKFQYEVTNDLYTDADLGKIDFCVSAIYEGNNYGGPVIIQILPNNINNKEVREPIEVVRWNDFRNDCSKSLDFSLDLVNLFDYSGINRYSLATNPLDTQFKDISKGKFDIEIRNLNKVLDSVTVEVVNTPWFHWAQLSDCSINEGESVKIYVSVKNLGGPSEFSVECFLYEATEFDKESLTQWNKEGDKIEGWWPAKTWQKWIYFDYVKIDKLGRNEVYSLEFLIPSDKLEANNVYILATDAIKQLPYLEFPEGNWLNSEHHWRARDRVNLYTIAVIAK